MVSGCAFEGPENRRKVEDFKAPIKVADHFCSMSKGRIVFVVNIEEHLAAETVRKDY